MQSGLLFDHTRARGSHPILLLALRLPFLTLGALKNPETLLVLEVFSKYPMTLFVNRGFELVYPDHASCASKGILALSVGLDDTSS
jgi:hypothetical protein